MIDAAPGSSIDFARLALQPGAGRRLEVEVEPGALLLGGQRYETPGGVQARIDVSRTGSGHAMRLAFSAMVGGPCVRCLEQAETLIEVEGREVEMPGGDEELHSPYVEDERLDVAAWSHDALALALPGQFLCRPDCAGLCAVCGISLNDADPEQHRHEQATDSRWAALDQLRES